VEEASRFKLKNTILHLFLSKGGQSLLGRSDGIKSLAGVEYLALVALYDIKHGYHAHSYNISVQLVRRYVMLTCVSLLTRR
jgi:hypothetical protein